MLSSCVSVVFRIFSRDVSYTTSLCQKCSSKPSKKLEPPWKILFFGNDQFAVESLKPLNAKLNTGTLISSLDVVTSFSTHVRKFSESEKLSILDWPIDVNLVKDKYDIGIVVSFGHMLPKNLIEAFPLGCINVHSSILPKYRGAAPITYAVLNGDSESGVTVMRIRPSRFDVGEIVRQYRVSISPTETCVELETRLAKCGADLLMECIRDFPRCVQMAVPQPSEGVCLAPKIKPSLAKIDWKNTHALRVFNMHRALAHVHPLSTTWRGVNVKITDLQIEKRIDSPTINSVDENNSMQVHKSALDFLNDSNPTCDNSNVTNAGMIEYDKSQKSLKVICNDGAKVVIKRLRMSGKNISASDFYNGYLSKVSQDEWIFGK